MLAEVRKCADNHDIKGLRYIFVDALDVDPTFDTYREDYEYCKTIPGMFDEHVNISPVVSDKSKWTTEYWEQLKLDLMKNFSEKRFEHMRLAAQVVYADKVSRLMTDRRKTVSASIPESVSKQPEIKTSAEASRKIHIEDNNNFTCIAAKPKDTTANQADLQKQRIDAQRRALETENRRIEAEQKKQREKIEAVRRAEANRQNIQSGGSESKKSLGDCAGSNNNSSVSGTYNSSATLTQSPRYNNATIYPRKLEKGPGYSTIYRSERFLVELSKTTLRKTTYSSGAESMFYLIDDTKKCSDIEFQSENWKRYPDTGNSQYWIFEQFDAKDKSRGIIRIIKKSMAQVTSGLFGIKVDVNPRYCTYYAKRNAPI